MASTSLTTASKIEEGLAKEEPRNKRRRKPYIRYEREYSMSAAHIDWFEKEGIKFCAILDDASRKILAAGELRILTLKTA